MRLVCEMMMRYLACCVQALSLVVEEVFQEMSTRLSLQ